MSVHWGGRGPGHMGRWSKAADPYAAYALALDFKNGIYRQGALITSDPTALSGYTYTRSGAKSEIANAGTIYPFAANVPGIVPGDGYWSRASLTNLITYSQDYSNGAWTKTTTALTSGQADPAGGTSAFLATESDVSPSVSAPITVVAATTYTASWVRKRGNHDWVRLQVHETANSANFVRFWVNLAAGQVGSNAANSLSIIGTPQIQSLANGYYRASISFQSPTATALTFFDCSAPSDNSGTTRAASGTRYVWQAQVVLGTQPGPIIVTAGDTATVGADSLAVTYAPADEDFVVLGTINRGEDVSGGRIIQLDDGTSNNRVFIANSGTSGAVMNVAAGGVTQVNNVNAGSLAFAAGKMKWALRHAAGKWKIYAGYGPTYTSGTESAAVTWPTGLVRVLPGVAEGAAAQLKHLSEFVGIRRGTFSDADITAILEAA